MTTIVFVDTDKAALVSLETSLQQSAKDWTLHFFDSGKDALELLHSTRVDCVVSDMHMHDMRGDQLLGQIASEFPQVVRIAVSALVDAEMTLESLHATHRFIAKPANNTTIIEAIQRSLDLWKCLDHAPLKHVIAGITALPVLPEIYNRLVTELASEHCSANSVGKIIESDIGLSATLLKVVNSPYYGLVQHVRSASHAAQLLGVELVKNVLLYENVLSQFNISDSRKDYISKLHGASHIRGVLASQFAKLAGFNQRQADHCQIGGMMGDLGELVLEAGLLPCTDGNARLAGPHALMPEAAVSVESYTTTHSSALFNADQIGSSIIGLWALPDPVVEAVLHQRDNQEPTGSLSAAHIIHVIRRLEAAWLATEHTSGEHFTVQQILPESAIDSTILENWFVCFCSYHEALDQAA